MNDWILYNIKDTTAKFLAQWEFKNSDDIVSTKCLQYQFFKMFFKFWRRRNEKINIKVLESLRNNKLNHKDLNDINKIIFYNYCYCYIYILGNDKDKNKLKDLFDMIKELKDIYLQEYNLKGENN